MCCNPAKKEGGLRGWLAYKIRFINWYENEGFAADQDSSWTKNVKSKPGDLNSWDQLRLRSRLSFVSRPELFIVSRLSIMSRSDFFSWLRFLKSRRFSRDFVTSRFLLRLLRFVETHQDLSKFVEMHPDLSRNLDII
jgi:hypothetical protein